MAGNMVPPLNGGLPPINSGLPVVVSASPPLAQQGPSSNARTEPPPAPQGGIAVPASGGGAVPLPFDSAGIKMPGGVAQYRQDYRQADERGD